MIYCKPWILAYLRKSVYNKLLLSVKHEACLCFGDDKKKYSRTIYITDAVESIWELSFTDWNASEEVYELNGWDYTL